ncbi:MAG: ABC transporter permease [Chloroflexota bacterium]|nr:ABC transporter permease [Chloroflexota bacterium]
MAVRTGGSARIALRTRGTAANRRRHSQSPLIKGVIRTARHPLGGVGLILLAILVLSALTAPWIAPYNPLAQHPGYELHGPGLPFLFGTDQFGRDLLSRVIYGIRPSLAVSLIVVGLGGSVGIGAGLVAGFLGGWVEAIITRMFDALFAFPAIMLGFVVVAASGPGTTQVAYAIALSSVPSLGRVARALVLRERHRDYVLAARSMGARTSRIMFRHILPNAVAPMFVNIALLMGFAVLAEAGLAFLGLGTQPPLPSLGGMLNESRSYLRADPWLAVWPGVALALLLLGLNYVADALREAFDPRRVNIGV